MKYLSGLVETLIGIQSDTVVKLILSVALIILAEVIRRSIVRVAVRRQGEPGTAYRWGRTSRYITFGLVLLAVGRIWLQGLESLVTYLGILSAGLAIALQDVLKNLAGWAFILWRRPFALGDRVQIGGQSGDVVDIRLFQFTLLEVGNWVHADQSTGRLIHVPNGRVFTESTANFYQGFNYIWSEIPVLLTFESNWKKAKGLLTEVAERHGAHLTRAAEARLREAASRYMIHYRYLTPIVYSSVQDSGVLLTIRYLCEPRKRRATDQIIWEDLLQVFADNDDMDFAYPTQRFYMNHHEGKLPLRAPGSPPRAVRKKSPISTGGRRGTSTRKKKAARAR